MASQPKNKNQQALFGEAPSEKPVTINLDDAIARAKARNKQRARSERRKPLSKTVWDEETLANDPHFAGDYMKTLMGRVKHVLSTHSEEWFSVQRLAPLVNGTETAVSSACRDLRKPKNGGHQVTRRRLEGDVSEYRWIR